MLWYLMILWRNVSVTVKTVTLTGMMILTKMRRFIIMKTGKRRDFRRQYVITETWVSTFIMLAWVLHNFKNQYYGQAVTNWLCVSAILLVCFSLMLPTFIAEKTKKCGRTARACLTSAAQHMPTTIMASFIIATRVSSDFNTTIATISVSSVVKFLIFGFLAAPILSEIIMLVFEWLFRDEVLVETTPVEMSTSQAA